MRHYRLNRELSQSLQHLKRGLSVADTSSTTSHAQVSTRTGYTIRYEQLAASSTAICIMH